MSKKYVYFFSKGNGEGNQTMKAIIGGKGANLSEMCNLGLPVPPGFTISTEVCKAYYENNRSYPKGLQAEIDKNLQKLEQVAGKKLNDSRNPLLVSVRSGAAVSMPGMMDTILNLGLNDKNVEGLAELTGNPRFAWDSYRRFIQMFGDVAMGVPHDRFEHQLEEVKRNIAKKQGVAKAASLVQEALNKAVPDVALDVNDLKEVVRRYKKVYKNYKKADFPQDPKEQLMKAINAVFGSWNNKRAIAYREINKITGLIGTAVNVQIMVFGNMGNDSGTGVGFTRNPSTGEDELYGEYLMNAQGEDVVAGTRTPLPIDQLKKKNKPIYQQLSLIRKQLENHYKDMQDFEFTMEGKTLYMLQTRGGKRTAQAAVKIAVDMVKDKLISQKEALNRITAEQLDQLLHPMLDESGEKKAKVFSTEGLPASPGAAVGKAVFTAEAAEKKKEEGEDVILCRVETSPEDIKGMYAAKGILTARGGMTSHAAVVARGMGKCCVAGAGDITLDEKKKQMCAGGLTVKEGDYISLNGTKGMVYLGQIETIAPEMGTPFKILMSWADKMKKLKVRTNADTPYDTKVAVDLGAEGIGLCRTEHMFFEGERIVSFRKLILVAPEVKRLRDRLESAENDKEKQDIEKQLKGPLSEYLKALNELLPSQKKDFEGIFKALGGKPCTIRLLDPPLHEFLPHDLSGQAELAKALKVKPSKVKRIVEALAEMNPMLGHRGCRLGISYPEITKMQATAIIKAALAVSKRKIKVVPEIMIPLVGTLEEFRIQKKVIVEAIAEVEKSLGKKLPFPVKIGTMIEVPRAALVAGKIAEEADFFSFGTNDLTQMGCGFSRDDAGKFLIDYVKLGIYKQDPFQSLDIDGIGSLVNLAVKSGRQAKKNLKIGICGEHGGDPDSIKFCSLVGLDYVSCSPFRVPIARLAAAKSTWQK